MIFILIRVYGLRYLRPTKYSNFDRMITRKNKILVKTKYKLHTTQIDSNHEFTIYLPIYPYVMLLTYMVKIIKLGTSYYLHLVTMKTLNIHDSNISKGFMRVIHVWQIFLLINHINIS